MQSIRGGELCSKRGSIVGILTVFVYVLQFYFLVILRLFIQSLKYDVLSVESTQYYTNITVDVKYDDRLPDSMLLPVRVVGSSEEE